MARELFAEQGVGRTSLQDIANRLGITKPALYYHFDSREELIRSILQPLVDEGEAFVTAHETLRAAKQVSPRALLEGYFDFHYKHRADLMLVVSELTALAEFGLVDRMRSWRERLTRLLFGGRRHAGAKKKKRVSAPGARWGSWGARRPGLLFGGRPTLEQSARATIALRGLQDCCLEFADADRDELRRVTVDGAIAALGL
ncbi:TetR family transcriptional regulator [Mycolicibacterium phlei DSM 43239 = CCUG 21000]|uniref:TetR family transcriptional regulator n=1 Tax=Mycolicibacterium phlei DSM 43239 = CCUG 21000 TaxID=1226750 RepID=A0A5N5UUY1_MYCPH|nr:TetR family transcriptional regulator [Mycolicibacterium phlei DSM 43239 = CCUG 21000]